MHESWEPLFNQYNINLDKLYGGDKIVYPEKENIFKVFEMSVYDIQILFLGQDPYHSVFNDKIQAHGLSFSVPIDVKIPPSLQNIYKELNEEFPEREYTFDHGNLERWFYEENIFLLNSSLSVIKNSPGSHMKIWEKFTNDVIKYVSINNEKCIFVLLGNYAKTKKKLIINQNNIIEGVHPSPLSAYNGFFGSSIFKKIEEKLEKQINWNI